MMHLTDENVYNLAIVTEEMQPYNAQELEYMEHLKTCEECYGKFCAALALLEVTSDAGYEVLAEIYDESHSLKAEVKTDSALAVLRVTRNKIEKMVSNVIEQISQVGAVLQFEPQLAFSTRGTGEENKTIFKVEDIETEKTFVVFDIEKNELLVQVDTKNVTDKEIIVNIEFENGNKLNIPIEKKGHIIKGRIDNIPEMDFKIHILAK